MEVRKNPAKNELGQVKKLSIGQGIYQSFSIYLSIYLPIYLSIDFLPGRLIMWGVVGAELLET